MSDLTFTLIQPSLLWEDIEANRQMLEQKINDIQQPTQIIVLPEMFTTGFSMKPEQLSETMQGPTVQWMKSMASKKRSILTGSLIIEDEGKYLFNYIQIILLLKYTMVEEK